MRCPIQPFLSLSTVVALVLFGFHSNAQGRTDGTRFGRDRALAFRTADGVTLKGSLSSSGNDDVVIYCHRLLGSHSGGGVRELWNALSEEYDFITFNFRGHKSSGHWTTAGGDEILDLRSVVSFAQREGYRRIIVIGAGMGGSVAVRMAGIFGGIDALVVLSPTGFAPDIQPFFVDLISDIALETDYGKVPIRILFNTRVGRRYTSGYPADLVEENPPVPLLVIQSRRDRFARAERVQMALEGIFEPADWLVVPGEMHADALLDHSTAFRIREWLEVTFSEEGDSSGLRDDPRVREWADSTFVILSGDLPLPEDLMVSELRMRLSRSHEPDSGEETLRHVRDILAFRGYTRVSLTLASSQPPYEVHVDVPSIHTVIIEGNRWVSEDHIRRLLRIGRDHFNAYELDAAIRRVSAEPAVRTVRPAVIIRTDGDLDIHLTVIERRPLRIVFSAKNTEIDKFYGMGFTWNEYTSSAFRILGSVKTGVVHGDLLTRLDVSKGVAGDHLRFTARYFDTIKSRDDVDFVYTRQEVQEVGGEFEVRYRATATTALTAGIFSKEYGSMETTSGFRVEEGKASGGVLKFDVHGGRPFGGRPTLRWKHTSYLQVVGPRHRSDFDFVIYQANLSGAFRLWRQLEVVSSGHFGRIGGDAPPQELFSLGGMTTLPGYADDAFVGSRVLRFSQAIRVGLGGWLDETSRFQPLRFILSFNSGTVWMEGESLSASDLKMDVGFEMDYEEMVRLGIAVPVGPLRANSPRIYIGWGPHVAR